MSFVFKSHCICLSYRIIAFVGKNDTERSVIRYILLLQEFNIEIKDRKDSKNSVTNHLPRNFTEFKLIGFFDHFPNRQLFTISHASLPWFAYIVNYHATRKIPPH